MGILSSNLCSSSVSWPDYFSYITHEEAALAEVKQPGRGCPVINKWWKLDFTQRQQSDSGPENLNTILVTSMRNKNLHHLLKELTFGEIFFLPISVS